MTPMNIILTPNLAYQSQAITLIKSILFHHQNVNFYVLNNDFPAEWFQGLNQYAEQLASYVFDVKVQGNACDSLATVNNLPPSSYFRFYSSELPLDKALYLDCDIVVNGDLTAMYQTDLGTNLVGAVDDLNICKMTKVCALQNMENAILTELYPQVPAELHPMLAQIYTENYFNSGVLLLNLAQWRAENTSAQLFDTAKNYSRYFRAGDQCTLNWVCKDRWKKFPVRYNYTSLILVRLNRLLPEILHEPELPDPAIIHYANPNKPWLPNKEMPFRETYWHYFFLEWQRVIERHQRETRRKLD